MRDTRLLQARQSVEAALEILADIIGEGITNSHDMLGVARAEKLLAGGIQAINGVYEVEACGTTNSVGSVCVKPIGHDGMHKASHGFQWDDESTERAARYIAKHISGRD